MKVHFAFVPPGGGDQEYMMQAEMPAVPREGDTILISRENPSSDQVGSESFVVRRATWSFLDYGGEDASAKFSQVWVEAEMAYGPLNSGEFIENLKQYEKRGKKVLNG